MSLYVKLFKTTSEYNAYTADTSNFILPNVSLCEDAPTTMNYTQLDPYNGHEYVEIGGLKWATMNIGASSVTDYGLYFQWGDVSGYTAAQVGTSEGKKPFYWDDYKYFTVNTTQESGYYYGGDTTAMTKYNSTDGKTVLEASDDAAKANWGGSWRMPTVAEFQALGNAVNTAWTADYQGSGIAGLILTDKTDSSKVLFFPAAGFCGEGNVESVGSLGEYWSSSLRSDLVNNAHNLGFSKSLVNWGMTTSIDRCRGYQVRGVVG